MVKYVNKRKTATRYVGDIHSSTKFVLKTFSNSECYYVKIGVSFITRLFFFEKLMWTTKKVCPVSFSEDVAVRSAVNNLIAEMFIIAPNDIKEVLIWKKNRVYRISYKLPGDIVLVCKTTLKFKLISFKIWRHTNIWNIMQYTPGYDLVKLNQEDLAEVLLLPEVIVPKRLEVFGDLRHCPSNELVCKMGW